jgi:hypothetical protein
MFQMSNLADMPSQTAVYATAIVADQHTAVYRSPCRTYGGEKHKISSVV